MHTQRDTALDKAVEKKHEKCAAVVRELGGCHSLMYAAEKGMVEAVAAGIAAGNDVNARDMIWVCICFCVFVAVCCGVLQCFADTYNARDMIWVCICLCVFVAVCCSVLQCVAVCCSVLQTHTTLAT